MAHSKKETQKLPLLLGTTAITGIRSIAVIAAGMVGLAANSAHAQVATDALPTGGSVASGSATLNYSTTQPRLDINQTSNSAIFDWDSFNIGTDAHTNFNQNSASSIAVNRVHDANPSQILGNLTANGQLVVLNQNGVFFGSTATVDVAGLVASTGTIDAGAFIADGSINLSDINTGGSIINEGLISVKDGGLAAFVAPHLINNGVINARLGRVALASGDTATVDLFGDGLVELAVDGAIEGALIENSGTISANGGTVAMTTAAAKGIVDSVINMDGVIEAKSVSQRGGKIILGGANTKVNVSGSIDATGGNGDVDIRGEDIALAGSTSIDVSADSADAGTVEIIANRSLFVDGLLRALGNRNGFIDTSAPDVSFGDNVAIQADTWLLDPTNITVDATLEAIIEAALGFGDHFLVTPAGGGQAGNIRVDEVIDWSSAFDLTFIAHNNIVFRNGGGINATGDGNFEANAGGNFRMRNNNNGISTNGGDVTVNADGYFRLQDGTINANGGNIDINNLGGFESVANSLITSGTGTIEIDQNKDADPDLGSNTIQNAINSLANAGTGTSTVNVGAGTWNESVLIDRAVGIIGVNRNQTFIAPTSNAQNGFTIDGNINGDVRIYRMNISNARDGVEVRDSAVGLNRLTISGVDFENNLLAGTRVTGNSANRVVISNSNFLDNGWGGGSAGEGDILFYLYNGDIVVRNTDIQNNSVPGLADYGIQIRGSDTLAPSGSITFDNVSVAGNYRAGQIGIQEFDGIGPVSFTDVVLGGQTDAATDSAGWASLYFSNLGAGDIDIGNTNFLGGDLDYIWNITGGNVDATGATFDTADNFVIEDNIVHKMDDPAFFFGLGLVTWVENTLFATTNNQGIQHAVNAADVGNDIFVDDGTYNESVTVDKSVQLYGNNHGLHGTDGARGDETIVIPNSPAFTITADDVVLDGFLLTGAAGDTGAFVDGGDRATITNNVITGQVGPNGPILGDGIFLQNSNGSVISNNYIHDLGDDGIQGNNADNITVTNNTIKRVGDAGIAVIFGSANATITDNEIIDADGGFGIRASGTGSVNVSDNIVVNTGDENRDFQNDAIHIDGGYSSGMISGNTVHGSADSGIEIEGTTNLVIDDNKISGTDGNGIYINGSDGTQVTNNEIASTGGAGVLVNPSLGVTISGNTIIYTDSHGIHLDHSDNATVSGNFIGTHAGAENIEGDGILIDNSNGATVSTNIIANTKSTSNGSGSGIQSIASDDVFLAGNTITNADWDGIRVDGGDNVELYDNTITNSQRAGIFMGDATNSTILLNTVNGTNQFRGISVQRGNNNGVIGNFVSNTHLDGIISNQTSNLTVRDNTVRNAGDDGIEVTNSYNAQITGNKIDGTAGNGIYVTDSNSVDIESNQINRNVWGTQSQGNGIYVVDSDYADVKYNKVDDTRQNGIYVSGSDWSEINNNEIDDASENGIKVNPSDYVDIANNTIHDVRYDGILVDDGKYADIWGNHVHRTRYGDGIDVNGNRGVEIWSNDIKDVGDHGIEVSDSSYALVSNNTIYNTDADGINVDGSYDATVRWNDIDETDGNGITLTGSAYADIYGNEINKHEYYANTRGHGIYVDDSYKVDVTFNDVDDTYGNGIYVKHSNGADVNYNTVTDAGENGIYLHGSDYADIKGNTIDDVDEHGIKVNPSDYVDIAYNTIHDAGYDGIHVEYGTGADIWGNHIGRVGDDGIDVYGNSGVEIFLNYIHDTGRAWWNNDGNGIEVDQSNYANISYNHIDDAGDDGIEIDDSDRVRVAGNLIHRAGDDGIDVDGGHGIRIARNEIDGSDDDGIVVDDNGRVRIIGNDVYNSGDEGIQVTDAYSRRRARRGGVNVVISDNNVEDTGGIGIWVDGFTRADINNNRVKDTDRTGIEVENGRSVDITNNRVRRTGHDGIEVDGVEYVDIRRNLVRRADNHGISVEDFSSAYIINNEIAKSGSDGIHVENEAMDDIFALSTTRYDGYPSESFVKIARNTVDESGDDGIDVKGVNEVRIKNNKVRDSEDDGIIVTGFGGFPMDDYYESDRIQSISDYPYYMSQFNAVIKGNKVRRSGGDGIETTGLDRARIKMNKINRSGENGILVSGPRNGTTIISGNELNNNPVGMRFESGKINLRRDANVINGGEIGMQFDPFLNQFEEEDTIKTFSIQAASLAPFIGPVSELKLAGDTFGTTEFNGQSDFYIRLEDGALFNPGTPTILDALDVSFDGTVPNDTGGVLDPVRFGEINDMIHDFNDEGNRGLIFFGIPSGADIDDILPDQDIGALINNPSALLTILGLPFTASPAGLPADILANIAPAAGDGTSPEELNELDPAAGGETVGCWDQAFNSLGSGASAVSYNMNTDALSQVNDANGCNI